MNNILIKFILIFILINNFLSANSQNFNQIQPKFGTLVLVHGLNCSKINMSMLASSFKQDGWNIENWSYPSRYKYIEEHAEDLVARLNQISNQNPNKPISFVTHSMGGLVLRCALNHMNCPNEAKIGRAVLIAPPNKGSVLARKLYKYKFLRWILGNKSGNQLMTTPRDGFDKFGNFPGHMPIFIISGTAGFNPIIPNENDGQVGVDETCLSTPHFHEKVWAFHSWICSSPTVIRKAKNFLSIY